MTSRRIPDDFTPNRWAALLSERRASGHSLLDLRETNPTRAGLAVSDAELQATLAGASLSRYDPNPQGSLEARAAVARYYATRGQASAIVDPERIVLTSSTSEAYAHVIRLLCGPGDEIVVPSPSYPLIEPLAELEHVRLEPYRLRLEDRWRADLDSLEAAIGPKTRCVVLVQPNNPTGSMLSESEVGAIQAICSEREIPLVCDEVFGDFPWPPRTHPLPTLAGSRVAPTIVLNGISKLCGLPQMKLGWMIVSGPDPWIDRISRGLAWIADLFLSVGAPVQVALPRLLGNRSGFQERVRARMERNLELLQNAASAGRGWSLLPGEGGWSAILRQTTECGVSPRPGHGIAEALLETRDIVVHPGFFYDLPETDVVVSLLVEPSILAEALSRMGRGETPRPRGD